MNRGQLKTRVSRMAGISLGTSDDQVDETQLLEELVNEAILDILVRTRIHVRRGTSALLPGASDFDIDDSVLRIWGLRRNSNLLAEQPREELDTNGFAIAGLSRITFGTPSGANEMLEFWYTPTPTPMTDDNHDPALQQFGRIPAEHHRTILDYMLWHSADKAGDQGAARGERYRILYEGQDGLGGGGSDLGRIRTHINMRGGTVSVRRGREVLAGDVDSSYWVG